MPVGGSGVSLAAEDVVDAMVLVRLPNHSNLTRMNKNYSLKTAPTAQSKEQKSQNRPKAKRIGIGVDVHLKSYHAACKIDNGAIGGKRTGQISIFNISAAFLSFLRNPESTLTLFSRREIAASAAEYSIPPVPKRGPLVRSER